MPRGADGALNHRATSVVARFASYTEISPSGGGVKLWLMGCLGSLEGRRTATPAKVELYDDERFFTVTGHILNGAPAGIMERQEELLAFHAELFPPAPRPVQERPPAPPMSQTEEEVLDAMFRAGNAADIRRLFDGSTDGYPSASEADLALASHVAFHAGPDVDLIKRVMRQSALIRAKWDREDYLDRTIQKALEGTTQFRRPRRRPQRMEAAAAEPPPPPLPLSTRSGGPLVLDPRDPLTTARVFIDCHFRREQCRALHCYQGEFFCWDGVRYVVLEDGALRKRLYEFMEPALRPHQLPDGGEVHVPFQPNTAKVNNVQDALRAVTHLNATLTAPAWLEPVPAAPAANEILAAQNGLVHLPSGALLPHSPLLFSTHAVPYAFDPRAPSPAEWRRFTAQLWPDDPESVESLQEWFGYSLTLDTSQQKILLIIGPPRSGKGTIGRVWTGLLGLAAVAAPTLASLEHNFGLWPLIGKSLAIISDARLSGRPDQAKIVERLLSISGEDVQTIDRKHREPWTGRLGTRIVIFTNELPRLADASGAMANRFIVLRLTQSFLGQEDTGLEARLLRELPGILGWAIEGQRRLAERGRFVQPESAAAEIQDLRDLSSPITAFVDECCVRGSDCKAPMPAVYQRWCAWCLTQGRDHPGTIQSFGKDLKAAVPELRESRLRIEGDRARYYVGIALRPPAGPRWSAVQPIAREGGPAAVEEPA